MRNTILAGVILAGVLTVGRPMARAQEQAQPSLFQVSSADLAVTYTTQHSTVTPSGAGSFWMQGAGLDGAFTFFRGLGLAASLTGEHASRIAPGVNLNLLTFTTGPRYTYFLHAGSKHEARLFGEIMAGGVKGFGSVFPVSTGVSSSASAFAWQAGGGIDIAISKHFAIRAVQADYVRTKLPNAGSNAQDNLRLSVGLTYHTGK